MRKGRKGEREGERKSAWRGREKECIAREREREDSEGERELNLLLKELREVERERG